MGFRSALKARFGKNDLKKCNLRLYPGSAEIFLTTFDCIFKQGCGPEYNLKLYLNHLTGNLF